MKRKTKHRENTGDITQRKISGRKKCEQQTRVEDNGKLFNGIETTKMPPPPPTMQLCTGENKAHCTEK